MKNIFIFIILSFYQAILFAQNDTNHVCIDNQDLSLYDKKFESWFNSRERVKLVEDSVNFMENDTVIFSMKIPSFGFNIDKLEVYYNDIDTLHVQRVNLTTIEVSAKRKESFLGLEENCFALNPEFIFGSEVYEINGSAQTMLPFNSNDSFNLLISVNDKDEGMWLVIEKDDEIRIYQKK